MKKQLEFLAVIKEILIVFVIRSLLRREVVVGHAGYIVAIEEMHESTKIKTGTYNVEYASVLYQVQYI